MDFGLVRSALVVIGASFWHFAVICPSFSSGFVVAVVGGSLLLAGQRKPPPGSSPERHLGMALGKWQGFKNVPDSLRISCILPHYG